MRRLFWILLALMMADYLAMGLWSLPRIAREAQGLLPFDLRPFGYDTAAARAFLTALSGPGRDFYLGVQQRLDLAYPALLATVLTIAFFWLFRPPWRVLFAAVAVLAAGFDYLENAAVAGLLRAGAQGASGAMIAEASRWTMLKSGFDALAFAALLVGLAAAIWRRRGAGK